MKNKILIIICSLLLCCDVIEPPYNEINNKLPAEKTVLIEKFTGHKCSNCPDATRKIKELQDLYPEVIIPVTIHPGGLSEFTDTDKNYPYDFTTNSGDTISNDMGAIFLPLGTVNRIDGGVSNRCFTKDQWASKIDQILYNSEGIPKPKEVEMDINTYLNKENKELTIETNLIFFNPGVYKLCLIIIEDGIISPQIDGAEYVENYEHNNVYRCSVNGIYGEVINTETGSLEWTGTHTILFNQDSNTNWTDDWDNINNCHVIAYVYDQNSLIIEESVKEKVLNE